MNVTGHRARFRPLMKAGLAVAISVAAMVASTSPASAFTVLPDNDPDGRLSVSGPMFRAVGDTRETAAVEVAELTVWPMEGEYVSDGDQKLIVEYTLQRRDGAGDWDEVETGRVFRTVSPGTTARVAPWSFARPDNPMSEEYRVEVLVSWIHQPTGFLLGSTTVVPGLWGDAVCETNAGVPCEPTMNGGLSF